MAEVDVSPEAVATRVIELRAYPQRGLLDCADLLEALSSALAEAEKERDALALERDSLTQHFSEAQEWMQEVRTACKKATGGNTTFIDDDAARAIYRCMAERDSALSQLAEARGENAWRPIESAPKTSDDFTSGALDFLAWCPDESARHGGDRRIVWWEPAMGRNGKGCWYCDADFEVHPTLWQPLPPLPSPSPAEGEGR